MLHILGILGMIAISRPVGDISVSHKFVKKLWIQTRYQRFSFEFYFTNISYTNFISNCSVLIIFYNAQLGEGPNCRSCGCLQLEPIRKIVLQLSSSQQHSSCWMSCCNVGYRPNMRKQTLLLEQIQVRIETVEVITKCVDCVVNSSGCEIPS